MCCFGEADGFLSVNSLAWLIWAKHPSRGRSNLKVQLFTWKTGQNLLYCKVSSSWATFCVSQNWTSVAAKQEDDDQVRPQDEQDILVSIHDVFRLQWWVEDTSNASGISSTCVSSIFYSILFIIYDKQIQCNPRICIHFLSTTAFLVFDGICWRKVCDLGSSRGFHAL